MEIIFLFILIFVIIPAILVIALDNRKYRRPQTEFTRSFSYEFEDSSNHSYYRKPPLPPASAAYITGAYGDIENHIKICRTVHERIPQIINENDILQEISQIQCKHYQIKSYKAKSKDEIEKLARKGAKKYAKQNTTKKFSERRKEIDAIISQKLSEFISLEEDKEKQLEQAHYQNEEKIRLQKDTEYKAEYDKKCEPYTEKITDDENIINANLRKCFSSFPPDIPPFIVDGSYSSSLSNTVTILLTLPSSEYVEHRKLTTTGKVSSVMRKGSEIVEDYYCLTNGLVLFVASKIFNVNTCIKNIHIETEVKELNGSIGIVETKHEDYYAIERNGFENINFLRANPTSVAWSFKSYSKPIAVPNPTKKPSPAKKAPTPSSNGSSSAKNATQQIVRKMVDKKSPYLIHLYDELSENSVKIIYQQVKFLFDKYGKSYFCLENNKRLLGAMKDLIPINYAERELIEVFVKEKFFDSFANGKDLKQSEKKLQEILSANLLENADIFTTKLKNLFGASK